MTNAAVPGTPTGTPYVRSHKVAVRLGALLS